MAAETFSERLTRLMGRQKIEAVAAAVGVAGTTIGRWMKGDRGIKSHFEFLENCQKLADYLGVSRDYLLFGDPGEDVDDKYPSRPAAIAFALRTKELTAAACSEVAAMDAEEFGGTDPGHLFWLDAIRAADRRIRDRKLKQLASPRLPGDA